MGAFDDLDKATGEQNETEASNDATETVEDEPAETVEQTESADVDPREEPAFPFDETKQTPIYVRGDTLDDWEEAKDFDVARILRRENDVKDVQGREIDDAVYRLAADNPELVAEYVMDARGIDSE